MEEKKIIKSIINSFFNGMSPSALLELCPNHMLWEAISRERAHLIAKEDIIPYLSQCDAFLVLQELIPAIQGGFEPEFVEVKSKDFLFSDKDAFWNLVSNEPTYLVSCDFSLMIVLTTENTERGDQLCALVSTV